MRLEHLLFGAVPAPSRRSRMDKAGNCRYFPKSFCHTARPAATDVQIIDNTERLQRGKREINNEISLFAARRASALRGDERDCDFITRPNPPPSVRRASGAGRFGWRDSREASQGVRRMPWLPQAMKDAVSCENVRGPANGG